MLSNVSVSEMTQPPGFTESVACFAHYGQARPQHLNTLLQIPLLNMDTAKIAKGYTFAMAIT